ncbi:MAG: hypothetical protein WBA12_06495, partial [Catalinimonas sp.]
MRKIWLLVGLSLLLGTANAQEKYWIFLSDTARACGATYNRPLRPDHLAALASRGVRPVCHSRWFRAVSAHLSAETHAAVRALPFVRAVRPVGRYLRPAASDPGVSPRRATRWGLATTQMEAHRFE